MNLKERTQKMLDDMACGRAGPTGRVELTRRYGKDVVDHAIASGYISDVVDTIHGILAAITDWDQTYPSLTDFDDNKEPHRLEIFEKVPDGRDRILWSKHYTDTRELYRDMVLCTLAWKSQQDQKKESRR